MPPLVAPCARRLPSAVSLRVCSDGTLQLEIQEADLVDAPLLRGVECASAACTSLRGGCARVHAYGAWCASDDKGRRREGGVHVTRSTWLVQGGEARDDELAFTELARYG